MTWQEFAIIVAVPVGRAVAGWLENALADGVITWPEWRELIKTVLRLGVPAAALFFGFDLPLEFATAIPVVADYGISMVRKALTPKVAKA